MRISLPTLALVGVLAVGISGAAVAAPPREDTGTSSASKALTASQAGTHDGLPKTVAKIALPADGAFTVSAKATLMSKTSQQELAACDLVIKRIGSQTKLDSGSWIGNASTLALQATATTDATGASLELVCGGDISSKGDFTLSNARLTALQVGSVEVQS
ncbi:hypothetical protein DVA67_015330 [Solirubrobacter sp. CPCC 204708]|uniref:Uncharacterized protein n=1 Tax=Solirubrobacter deserti TaxID=2282478 RepID=A0ABT4RKN3_9ACTN|nr:hypothetical protein [Solirubrobacter deserti]MBE2317353.1 hypothetical protein [Solirubrobacter deserti]MDA0139082.1 hypothetical protein [Solirubrobacter deserti]